MGHALAVHHINGTTAIRRHFPLEGSPQTFTFAGPKWIAAKDDLLSLMAPTEYGPSIKAMRWLRP